MNKLEDDKAFDAIMTDLEKTLNMREILLPLGMITCIFGSAAWFYRLGSIAAFLSSATIMIGCTLIWLRIKVNKIAEKLQRLVDKDKEK